MDMSPAECPGPALPAAAPADAAAPRPGDTAAVQPAEQSAGRRTPEAAPAEELVPRGGSAAGWPPPRLSPRGRGHSSTAKPGSRHRPAQPIPTRPFKPAGCVLSNPGPPLRSAPRGAPDKLSLFSPNPDPSFHLGSVPAAPFQPIAARPFNPAPLQPALPFPAGCRRREPVWSRRTQLSSTPKSPRAVFSGTSCSVSGRQDQGCWHSDPRAQALPGAPPSGLGPDLSPDALTAACDGPQAASYAPCSPGHTLSSPTRPVLSIQLLSVTLHPAQSRPESIPSIRPRPTRLPSTDSPLPPIVPASASPLSAPGTAALPGARGLSEPRLFPALETGTRSGRAAGPPPALPGTHRPTAAAGVAAPRRRQHRGPRRTRERDVAGLKGQVAIGQSGTEGAGLV
ncbi:uncharacterized protein LOC133626099 [Colius striatus]|uniref:uncharacterized protein LOC133626099 n=1 Tax=Colius striatus TaxID=57412 RepID=UPI002B1E8661|nr:uncharacterized protein LOC133626099 [Colius striatus]